MFLTEEVSNIQKTRYANVLVSSRGRREQSSCELTNRRQKWRGTGKLSSQQSLRDDVASLNLICTKFDFSPPFVILCGFWGEVQLSQQQNSLVVMTGGATVHPLQSTCLGGGVGGLGWHTTLGRLHRHTAFRQLPYGISYRVQLGDCRLTS